MDDIRLPDALHVGFVRSPWAHARITSIDGSVAAALPDTKVFTATDLALETFPPPPFVAADKRMFRPPLAADTVRFVGEIVAVTVAPSREAAADAADLVVVDYEPLPVVTDPLTAARDEVVLFPEVGTNVCLHSPAPEPDEHLFDSCDTVTSGTVVSQRIAPCPVEPRANVAQFDEAGRLTMWMSTQTPHQDRDDLARSLGLDARHVRVVAPDVGGGFGGKGLAVEDVIVAHLARAIGRPVRWTEPRRENLVAMHHGRAQRIEFEIGGNREGRIDALRLKILQDAGAYPGIGSFLPILTARMASGVYRIPKIECDVKAVVTNTTPTGPVRGAGRPEAAQVLERAMDRFAAELSMDPAEVRRRNFIEPDAFPFTTASGAAYDSGDYGGALTRVLDATGYESLRAEQANRRRSRTVRQLGIGLSTYVEVTNGVTETEFGAVEMTSDGEAIVKTGSLSQGQGLETTFAMIVAQRLGLPIERLTVIRGDTDEIARGTGTYGSKSTQIGGVAAGLVSEKLMELAKHLAAEELEASAEDMVLDIEHGRFHVAGAPSPALTWGELAGRLHSEGRLAELSAEVDFQAPQPTFPFGAHLAVVEIDIETGAVELTRMVALDDAGRIINPLIAEGQVHGGLAAGIAQALYEELTYDEHGNPRNANLVTHEHVGLPANSERVWRALEEARAGASLGDMPLDG